MSIITFIENPQLPRIWYQYGAPPQLSKEIQQLLQTKQPQVLTCTVVLTIKAVLIISKRGQSFSVKEKEVTLN